MPWMEGVVATYWGGEGVCVSVYMCICMYIEPGFRIGAPILFISVLEQALSNKSCGASRSPPNHSHCCSN